MKNKVYNKLIKSISKVLVVAMVASAGLGFYTGEVKAAEVTTETVFNQVTFSTEKMDVTKYWSADEKKAPVKPGYVFGGWYEEKDESTVITDMAGVTQAYAKWVPAQVLGVKTQVSLGKDDTGENIQGTVDANSENVSLRIVSSVDSLKYEEIGFVITALTHGKTEESTWYTKEEFKTTVYKNYNADDTTVGAADVFGEPSKYFFAKTITKIPNVDNFDTGFYATPYWVTMDGTKVTGLAKYVHVEDFYENYVSVPVYMRTENVKVMAGIVEVQYDSDALTYVREKVESGKLFEECAAASNTAGIVKCVANTKTVDEQDANGMYINLRFKKTAAAIAEEQENGSKTYTFKVTADEKAFCDSVETFKVVEVQDITY